MTEVRVPIERINAETGEVTGTGTALMRGVTLDQYQTKSGAEMKLRPGEMFVIVTTMQVEETPEERDSS